MKKKTIVIAAAVLASSLLFVPAILAQGTSADAGSSTANSAADSSAAADTSAAEVAVDETITVAEAKALPDATEVALKGTIQSSLGQGQYIFTDHTGSITLQISEEVLSDAEITQGSPVIIYGEVDVIASAVNIAVKDIENA